MITNRFISQSDEKLAVVAAKPRVQALEKILPRPSSICHFRRILASASALALLTVGLVARAEEPTLAGEWRGSAETAIGVVTFNLVIGSDGSYSEQAVAGSLMTWQTGHYQFTAADTISLVVEDWAPKNQRVYRVYPSPADLRGGYWETQQVAKPPGGTYRIRLASSDSFTREDVNSAAVVAFYRLH